MKYLQNLFNFGPELFKHFLGRPCWQPYRELLLKTAQNTSKVKCLTHVVSCAQLATMSVTCLFEFVYTLKLS